MNEVVLQRQMHGESGNKWHIRLNCSGSGARMDQAGDGMVAKVVKGPKRMTTMKVE